MTQKFEVGQKLWWVPNRHTNGGQPKWVTIAKVGRKWLTTECRRRISKDTTMWEEGFNARCYLGKEVHETELARRDAWHKFRAKTVSYVPPKGASVEAIKQAYQLLFGEEMK